MVYQSIILIIAIEPNANSDIAFINTALLKPSSVA
jgi:hypothetical protein